MGRLFCIVILILSIIFFYFFGIDDWDIYIVQEFIDVEMKEINFWGVSCVEK